MNSIYLSIRRFQVLFILLFSLVGTVCLAQNDDGFFANIAKQTFEERHEVLMETPAPPILENILFDWNGGDPVVPMDKIDTYEELKRELGVMREKYHPFLKNLSPELEDVRLIQNIEKMQFRLETKEDCNDFLFLNSGKGKWDEVPIPHYTGPGEQAVAWYRTTFMLSDEMKNKERLFIHFNGVEYFADIFVNGHFVGNHEGYFGAFECEFTPYAHTGKNVLLVKVRNSSRLTIGSSPTAETNNREHTIPRTYGDKLQASNSLGWDEPHFGWNGTPNGFGINQGVYIEAKSDLFINDVFPRPILSDSSVIVSIEVDNLSEQNRKAVLKASVFGRNFEEMIIEDVEENCEVIGTRPVYRIRIPIRDPRLWTLEEPWLYQIQIKLEDEDGRLLDTYEKHFGMRSFEQKYDSKPIGRFYLNNKEIRLRGANTMGSFQLDVYRRDWDQLVDDILLAKITNMNFLRCTQTIMPHEFYDYCDMLGFMAQSDLPLFAKLSYKKVPEAIKQASEMVRVVRSHPSNCLVSFINEPHSNGTGGFAFAITREELEDFFTAAEVVVRLENPDQVIKFVDGDYNPPSSGMPDNHCYSGWYGDHCISNEKLYEGYWCKVKKGWMFGCGEFGVEGLDPVNTMLKYYPKEWVSPNEDGTWNPDKIEGSQTWDMYDSWYPKQKTMEDWVDVSQAHQRDVIKLKTEAFRRMSRMNTFAVHLFIDAWPNGWLKTIMDVQRQPKPAWYAYKDALAPIAIQVKTKNVNTIFTPGNTTGVEIWICNDTHQMPECEIAYQLEIDTMIVQTGRISAKMPSIKEGSGFQGFLPVPVPHDIQPKSKLKLRVSLVEKPVGNTIDQYVYDIPVQK